MNRTGEELLEHHKTQLGSEFGTAFHGLYSEWAWGLIRLNEYRELFSREEDVVLLNALTGGAFTWDIQRIFWDDLLLRVCRLTDPPEMGSNRNLSVGSLTSFVNDEELHLEVSACVKSAKKKARFARPLRNKRISHSDWDRAMKQGKPLTEATLQQVEEALDAVHAVLNAISLKLLNAELANTVVTKPRARAFLCYAQQLVGSVKFIDDLIDGESRTEFRNHDAARSFLRKLGCEPAGRVGQVIELRKAARRFDQS